MGGIKICRSACVSQSGWMSSSCPRPTAKAWEGTTRRIEIFTNERHNATKMNTARLNAPPESLHAQHPPHLVGPLLYINATSDSASPHRTHVVLFPRFLLGDKVVPPHVIRLAHDSLKPLRLASSLIGEGYKGGTTAGSECRQLQTQGGDLSDRFNQTKLPS